MFDRTRQNANTSHVTTKAPATTPSAMRRSLVGDIPVDLSLS
jgi:hypothetical protein